MKKYIYIFFLCGMSLYSFAQEEVSTEIKETKAEKPKKDVHEYLPAAGDIAIGVDALPYLEFLGNMFSGHNSRNRLDLSSTTIYGKYYVSPNSAIRAELYLNNSTNIDMNYVQDDANVATNPNAQVEDKRKIKNDNFGIGVGYQFYRGYGRLRGTYGAVASYFRGNSITDYEWGNQMTASNATPTSTNWYGAGNNPSERNISVKNSGSNSVSVGVIGGVEYFFAPKICIGGEFGLYYSYNWYAQENVNYQTVEQGTVREYELATDPQESYSSLSTRVYDASNVAGTLYLLFHF